MITGSAAPALTTNEVIVLLCADWSEAKAIVGDRKKIG